MPQLWNAFDDLLDTTIFFSFTRLGHAARRRRWPTAERDMSGQVCLVTGANAGLGYEVAHGLAQRGAVVHMLCRNRERGLSAQQAIRQESGNDDVHLHLVDLSDQASIRAFAAEWAARQIDVLVNNAGVLLPERRESVDGIELTLATNVLGYFLLTELLLPHLRGADGARVINVTSGGMYTARLHPDDLQFRTRPFNGTQAYAEAKRGNVVMTALWAKEWAGSGIAVHAVHPGWAATPGVAQSLPGFNRLMGPLLRTPAQGADGILWLCVTPELAAPGGQLWFDRRVRPTQRFGQGRNSAAEVAAFWRACHTLTGLR